MSESGCHICQESGVGRGIEIGAEGGTCRVQTALTGGLEGEAVKVMGDFILASVRNTATLIIRALLVNNFRCWYANRLALVITFYIFNKSASACKTVIRHLAISNTSKYDAFLVCTCHIIRALFVTRAFLLNRFYWFADFFTE